MSALCAQSNVYMFVYLLAVGKVFGTMRMDNFGWSNGKTSDM